MEVKESIGYAVAFGIAVLSLSLAYALASTGQVSVHVWMHRDTSCIASESKQVGVEIGKASGTWTVKFLSDIGR